MSTVLSFVWQAMETPAPGERAAWEITCLPGSRVSEPLKPSNDIPAFNGLGFWSKVWPTYGFPAKPEDPLLSSLLPEVCGPQKLNDETPPEGKLLIKLTTPGEAKQNLREQLRNLGMHEAALFPSSYHLGSYVRKQWSSSASK